MRGGACAGTPLRASKARQWLAREDVQKMCSQAAWWSAMAKMRSNNTRRAACNWARVLEGAARHGSQHLHCRDRRDERNEEENRTLEAGDRLDSRSGSRLRGSGGGRSLRKIAAHQITASDLNTFTITFPVNTRMKFVMSGDELINMRETFRTV